MSDNAELKKTVIEAVAEIAVAAVPILIGAFVRQRYVDKLAETGQTLSESEWAELNQRINAVTNRTVEAIDAEFGTGTGEAPTVSGGGA